MRKTTSKTPVVAVLNMKGGVGKTTVCANLFRMFFEHKRKRILLIDLDPQFNLTQGLIPETLYTSFEKKNRTILAAMESPPTKSLYKINAAVVTPPAAETLGQIMRHFLNEPKVSITLIPGDFRVVKYSLMDEKDAGRLEETRAAFLRFVAKARSDYDLIVIDCNPSSSFLTICALHAATHVLAPVRLDRYSILGIKLMQQLIDRLPLKKKPRLSILINGIKRTDQNNSIEKALRLDNKFGDKVLFNKIYESRVFNYGNEYAGFAIDRKGARKAQLRIDLTKVSDELAKIVMPK